jgi:hypothetical protein
MGIKQTLINFAKTIGMSVIWAGGFGISVVISWKILVKLYKTIKLKMIYAMLERDGLTLVPKAILQDPYIANAVREQLIKEKKEKEQKAYEEKRKLLEKQYNITQEPPVEIGEPVLVNQTQPPTLTQSPPPTLTLTKKKKFSLLNKNK